MDRSVCVLEVMSHFGLEYCSCRCCSLLFAAVLPCELFCKEEEGRRKSLEASGHFLLLTSNLIVFTIGYRSNCRWKLLWKTTNKHYSRASSQTLTTREQLLASSALH